MSKLVTFIARRNECSSRYDSVKGIGGHDAAGVPWWRSELDAIRDILLNVSNYCVAERLEIVTLTVGYHSGRKYLKTASERFLSDEFLGLEEYPDCDEDDLARRF